MAKELVESAYLSHLEEEVKTWRGYSFRLETSLERSQFLLALAVMIAAGLAGACGWLVAHYVVRIV